MKKFLVLYHAPHSAVEQMANATPEQAKAGMDAWMGWARKAGPAIADLGMPLPAPGWARRRAGARPAMSVGTRSWANRAKMSCRHSMVIRI